MTTIPLVAAITSALLMTGVAANEMSHGDFAESMGLGHHHLADYDGVHCAGPGDDAWAEHQEHMHNGTAPADHCGGDHMDGSMHPGSMGGR